MQTHNHNYCYKCKHAEFISNLPTILHDTPAGFTNQIVRCLHPHENCIVNAFDTCFRFKMKSEIYVTQNTEVHALRNADGGIKAEFYVTLNFKETSK